MLATLSILTVLLLLATLLPLSRHPHWMIRSFDFPRLQLAALAACLLVAQVYFLDIENTLHISLLVINAFCLIWQIVWILPYTFFWPKEVKISHEYTPDKQICILTSNVLTPNRNADALIRLVNEHKPDILVTLESDKWWENKLNVLESDMPYTIKCPLDNLYGMHVYSRLLLNDEEISFLVEKDVPSIHTSITLKSGHKIRAHFLHPAPPSPSENTESAERDAELIIVAQSVRETVVPVIVTGDLNDVAWSATTRLFRKISGLLDPRIGRGIFNTFHVDYPFLRWPLDHLFHSQHFTLKDIRRLPTIGSDHFPLMTTLCFSTHQHKDQLGLEASNDDKDKAKEICDKKQVSHNDVPKPQ